MDTIGEKFSLQEQNEKIIDTLSEMIADRVDWSDPDKKIDSKTQDVQVFLYSGFLRENQRYAIIGILDIIDTNHAFNRTSAQQTIEKLLLAQLGTSEEINEFKEQVVKLSFVCVSRITAMFRNTQHVQMLTELFPNLQSKKIQLFMPEELLFNKTKHELVPKDLQHYPTEHPERQVEILKQYLPGENVTLENVEQLPKIKIQDPIAKHFFALKGDIIEGTEISPTNIQSRKIWSIVN